MTQKEKIINAFKRGEKLTTLTAALKGLGVKLPTRVGELERDTKMKFKRVKKCNKKTNTIWFEYSLIK